MKTSALKASKELAEGIWNELQGQNITIGRDVFRRKETENGFMVSAPIIADGKYARDENNKVIRTRVFEYSKSEIGSRVDWDENLITIK